MAAAVPEWQLARVKEGYVTTQLLYVAAKLGIPEVRAAGPRTGAQVAEAVGADPAAVTRVLRGPAVEEVVDELDDERFALTALGQALPALQGPIVVRGELYYRAAAGLLDVVREGGTAFERVYGERFFDHLEHHPDHEAAGARERTEAEFRRLLADARAPDRLAGRAGRDRGDARLIGAQAAAPRARRRRSDGSVRR